MPYHHDNFRQVRRDGSVAQKKISENHLIMIFNPSCDGISPNETLNQAIDYEVA